MFDKLFADPDKEGFPIFRCIFLAILFFNGEKIFNYILLLTQKTEKTKVIDGALIDYKTLSVSIATGLIICFLYVLCMSLYRYFSLKLEFASYGKLVENNLKKEQDFLQDEKKELIQENRLLKQESEKLELQNVAVQRHHDSTSKEITNLKNEKNELQNQVDTLSTAVKKQSKENHDLLKENVNLAREEKELTEKINNGQDNLTNLEKAGLEAKKTNEKFLKEAIQKQLSISTSKTSPNFNKKYNEIMTELGLPVNTNRRKMSTNKTRRTLTKK